MTNEDFLEAPKTTGCKSISSTPTIDKYYDVIIRSDTTNSTIVMIRDFFGVFPLHFNNFCKLDEEFSSSAGSTLTSMTTLMTSITILRKILDNFARGAYEEQRILRHYDSVFLNGLLLYRFLAGTSTIFLPNSLPDEHTFRTAKRSGWVKHG